MLDASEYENEGTKGKNCVVANASCEMWFDFHEERTVAVFIY